MEEHLHVEETRKQKRKGRDPEMTELEHMRAEARLHSMYRSYDRLHQVHALSTNALRPEGNLAFPCCAMPKPVATNNMHNYSRVAWKPYSYHSQMPDSGEPLPWCARHQLHESGVIWGVAYCPWVDPVRGPKLRAVEKRYEDRLRDQRRDAASKNGSGRKPMDILAKMGLTL